MGCSVWDGPQGGDVGRKITEDNVSVGKESYAEGLGLDSAVGVERTKQILEIFRRQISRLECGERRVWEKPRFLV